MGSNQVTGHEEKKKERKKISGKGAFDKDSINSRVYQARQQSTNLGIVV